MRNSSIKTFLFSQTLKDVEKIHREVGGYYMSYDEFQKDIQKIMGRRL